MSVCQPSGCYPYWLVFVNSIRCCVYLSMLGSTLPPQAVTFPCAAGSGARRWTELECPHLALMGATGELGIGNSNDPCPFLFKHSVL